MKEWPLVEEVAVPWLLLGESVPLGQFIFQRRSPFRRRCPRKLKKWLKREECWPGLMRNDGGIGA